MYAAGALALTLLGGSVIIELPADKKIAALEDQFTQTWQQQQTYHSQRELDDLQWRLRYISNEINRINAIPQYLKRGLTPEETWQIQQYKEEWQLLQERLHRIKGG